MILDFEPGLADRYRSLKDCMATCIYKRGLSKVAIDLDQAPSNLSVQLSEDGSRHFSIDSFEAYLAKTEDFTPLYYLCEKFLGDKQTSVDDELERQLEELATQIRNRKRRAA